MQQDIIARRYAKAFVSLATNASNLNACRRQFDAVARLIAGGEYLRSYWTNPLIPLDRKIEVLGRLADAHGGDDLVLRFLKVLARAGRLGIVDRVARELGTIVDEIEGTAGAEATTACQLSDAQKSALSEALSRWSGKTVVLETRVDPRMLGGVVVRMGDMILDGSVEGKLRMFAEAMAKTGASDEHKAG